MQWHPVSVGHEYGVTSAMTQLALLPERRAERERRRSGFKGIAGGISRMKPGLGARQISEYTTPNTGLLGHEKKRIRHLMTFINFVLYKQFVGVYKIVNPYPYQVSPHRRCRCRERIK
jgi:hypothetical protein